MELRAWLLCLAVSLLNQGCTPTSEDRRQALIADGWREVTPRLEELLDTTWYGQSGPGRSFLGYVYYFKPNGETGLLRTPQGKTYVDRLTRAADGRLCHRFEELHDGKPLCFEAIWQRGDHFLFADEAGRIQQSWRRTNGNPEAL